MAKIKSERSQRLKAIFGILFVAFLIGVLILAWQLSRTVDFSWEQANAVEAAEARRKLKLLTNGIAAEKKGFVRLTQLEVNSYLLGAATNTPAEGRLKLSEVKVSLTRTNFTLVSAGEADLYGMPLPLTLSRTFRVEQEGTNSWAFPLEEVHIGELKVPRQLWPQVARLARRMDAPLGRQLAWATNVPALRIARNEISGDPELRLYTYKPGLLD